MSSISPDTTTESDLSKVTTHHTTAQSSADGPSYKKATLYRMVMDQHFCPFGLKTKSLLQRHGYQVEDKPLRSRQAVDELKEKYAVKTTPQVFIDNQRIGGYEETRRHLGLEVKAKSGVSYRPIIAIFSMTALMALALTLANIEFRGFQFGQLFSYFMALSISVLAILKLQDVESFSSQFLGYDLLAQKWVPYAYIYPFAEAAVGVGLLLQFALPIIALIALMIGSIGAVSVFKAVYIDKRDIKCACVGGNSNVPLGFVSLTENLMMILMGIVIIL